MKRQYDVIIVGCGVAGCFAALHLPKESDILMITKSDLEESDSFLAQGGICVLKNEEDYDSFYELELRLRRVQNAPPFADFAMVTFQGVEEPQVLRCAVKFRDSLLECLARPEYGEENVRCLGPAPCPVPKINYHFRYRLTVNCRLNRKLRLLLAFLLRQFGADKGSRGVTAFVDVNGFE